MIRWEPSRAATHSENTCVSTIVELAHRGRHTLFKEDASMGPKCTCISNSAKDLATEKLSIAESRLFIHSEVSVWNPGSATY